MFRLAHLSDIHLSPMPVLRRRQLMSKRITGYVNWRRNRVHTHQPEVLTKLLADLSKRNADHIAVTGDLINLGLDSEINNAREWLELLGAPDDVTVVCGNHDAYVPGSLAKALDQWQPWVAGDDGRLVCGSEDFPTLRRRGPVSLIGCNSARATMPFLATGFFRGGQANRLGAILDKEGLEGRFRVVLIHHPPVRGATGRSKRLNGQSLFRRVIAQHGAELVLHGHTHLNTVHHIPGPDGPVPVVGVPSGAQAPLAAMRKPAARYNLFDIAKTNEGWSVGMEEYGYDGPGSQVDLIAKLQLR
jgi:3',5'-cyclic AMP phosphodiesterase CpdA